jgi:type VI protein secretion system component Hcp
VANRVCSGISVTKQIDSSSPVLSTAALLGGVYPTMTLEFTAGTEGRSYLTYVLSNVTVNAVCQSSGGDLIHESVSLFAAIWPQGTPKAPGPRPMPRIGVA